MVSEETGQQARDAGVSASRSSESMDFEAALRRRATGAGVHPHGTMGALLVAVSAEGRADADAVGCGCVSDWALRAGSWSLLAVMAHPMS